MDTRCPTKKLVLIIQNGSKQIDIKPDSFGFNQDKSRNKRGFSFKIVCLQQENKKHTNQMKSQEHPFAQFHFCPKCGSAEFEIHNEKSRHCRACGFTYYFNPSAATVGIIVNERRELLVCRRAKDPAKGTLDLPGGFCDCQETGEEGIIREVKEETGLTLAKYIQSRRLDYARQLLLDGVDVQTICDKCGIRSQSHFISLFKGEYGMTPGEFCRFYR